uniref:Uncharacterized protein n=1 Tax=Medicago truncatula TaxID=3880 RepID=I3S8Y1_MEDTR|nr:unknown [Medicago truncatula]
MNHCCYYQKMKNTYPFSFGSSQQLKNIQPLFSFHHIPI